MELQPDNVLANIHNCTPEALDFIEKWFDESPYITARTSGSTGRPKPIRLLKSDMRVSAMSTNRFFKSLKNRNYFVRCRPIISPVNDDCESHYGRCAAMDGAPGQYSGA